MIEFYWNGSFVGHNYYMVVDGYEISLGAISTSEKEAKEEAIYILKENYGIDYNINDIEWKWGGCL